MRNPCMASIPLRARLRSTCCSCTRSPRAGESAGSSSSRMEMSRTNASLRMSRTTSATVSLRSRTVSWGAPFLRSARSRSITAAARMPSSTISPRISRNSPRSMGSTSMRRWPAWAQLRIAVNGWLSSCASDVVSSPIVATRLTWPRSSRSFCNSTSATLRANRLANTSPTRWSCCFRSSDVARSSPIVLNTNPPTIFPPASSGSATCGLTRYVR